MEVKLAGTVLMALFLFNCTPNEDNYGIRPVNANVLPEKTSEKLLAVIHEGNFTWGNASVTLIDLDSNTTFNGVFNAANNELLGDVGQSMYVSGDTGWIVVNNSGKIEMVNLPSFQRIKQLTGFVSPRYMDCDGEYCFVTDIYANQLSVLNKTTGDLIRSFPLKGWSEEIKATNNMLYINYLDSVQTSNTTKLISVNQTTGSVEDTLFKSMSSVDFTSEFAFVIQENSLYQYNYNNRKKELLSNKLPSSCSHLTVSIVSKFAYFISNESLYKIDWSNAKSPEVITSLSSYNPYNMKVSTNGDFIFLVDVSNFTSNGRVLQYTPDGKLYREYSVGVLPNDLTFL